MFTRPSLKCLGVLAVLSLTCLAGCRDSDGVATVTVSGNVMLDDEPLVGAGVNFLGSQYAGICKTDAQGRFRLKAQPGTNRVYFSKYEGEVDPTMVIGFESAKAAKLGPKQLIPKKYATDATEIKHEVPTSGQSGIVFKLSR